MQPRSTRAPQPPLPTPVFPEDSITIACRPITHAAGSTWRNGPGANVSSIPAAPSGITYADSTCDGNLDITWQAPAGATSYVLQRATGLSFSGAVQVYAGPLTSYRDTNLGAGTYYYRVLASNACGSGDWQNGGPVLASSTPPAPATIGTTATICGEIAVTWAAVGSATSYVVERAASNSFAGAIEVYNGAATSFTQTGLTEVGPYYYRVLAKNSCGSSAWKAATAVSVLLPPSPPATIATTATTCGEIAVTWTAAGGATGYIVERAASDSFTGAVQVYNGPSTSVTQTGLTEQGPYYYRVLAKNSCGNSAWKAGTAVSVLLPPSPPATIATTATTCGEITVTWTAASSATGYIVERAASDSFAGAVQVYNGPSTSFTQTGLTEPGPYYYRVLAKNSCGNSAWKAGTAVRVLLPPSPPATIATTAANCGEITVTWAAAGDATGYIVERAASDSFAGAIEVYNGPLISFTETGLTQPGPYYYRVLAKNSCGNSAWRTATAVSPVLPPSSPATIAYTAINCGEITVTWAAVGDATSYIVQRAASDSFTGAIEVYNGTCDLLHPNRLDSAGSVLLPGAGQEFVQQQRLEKRGGRQSGHDTLRAEQSHLSPDQLQRQFHRDLDGGKRRRHLHAPAGQGPRFLRRSHRLIQFGNVL